MVLNIIKTFTSTLTSASDEKLPSEILAYNRSSSSLRVAMVEAYATGLENSVSPIGDMSIDSQSVAYGQRVFLGFDPSNGNIFNEWEIDNATFSGSWRFYVHLVRSSELA